MGYQFDTHQEAELDASPEQAWNAIASGPGIDSWYMGRNEVEPGPAGTVRTMFGDYVPEYRVTEWDPPRRLGYRSDKAPDGRFVAHEFLIEGRDQGSTSLRMVVSGFLPGDDWEAEYEAMTKGGALHFNTLVEYLTHFAGRTATPVTAFGPMVSDWNHAWSKLHAAVGATGPVTAGARVRFTGPAGEPIDGVVYFANSDTLGIRTGDAMYRFIKGFFGPMIAGHHIFADVDQDDAEQAWQSWLSTALA